MGPPVASSPAAADQHPAPSGGAALERTQDALRRPGTLAILGALTLLAAALRFGTLDVQSIWLDESATLILVHRGLWGMLSHLSSSESAPPLYYTLVWLWSKIFGAGPLGFRSFSALIGTVTVPVMYAAGRRASERVGLWAAALTVVSPAMYYYSQEARAYGLLILFSAAAFVLWQRALEKPDTRNLALWALWSSLAVLTHYFAVFLFVPEALLLIRRFGLRRVRLAVGAVVLVGLALVPLALAERSDGKSNWIEAESLTSRIGATVKQYAVGLYTPLEIPAGVLVVALAGAGALVLWRRGEERELKIGREAVLLVLVSLALPLFLAVTGLFDVFGGRNVIATWVPLAVLIAGGLGAKRAGRTGPLLGAALCAVSLAVIIGIDTKPAYQRDDWRGIADTLALPAPASPVSRVVVAPEFGSLPLSVYLGTFKPATGETVSAREIVFVNLRIKRSARAPLPAFVPTSPPAGFRLAQVRRTASYAVSRFRAPRTRTLSDSELRRLVEDPKAEIAFQP